MNGEKFMDLNVYVSKVNSLKQWAKIPPEEIRKKNKVKSISERR